MPRRHGTVQQSHRGGLDFSSSHFGGVGTGQTAQRKTTKQKEDGGVQVQQTTTKCSECGQPVPEPPVTVTIPARPIAVIEDDNEDGGIETLALGRPYVQLLDSDESGLWTGPTLLIKFANEGHSLTTLRAKIALEEHPSGGPDTMPDHPLEEW
jgi:hypothetical protein